MSLLSGCPYSAGSQKKRHGHMFYRCNEGAVIEAKSQGSETLVIEGRKCYQRTIGKTSEEQDGLTKIKNVTLLC